MSPRRAEPGTQRRGAIAHAEAADLLRRSRPARMGDRGHARGRHDHRAAHALSRAPDLVVSGINRGGNLRKNLLFFRHRGRGDGSGHQSHSLVHDFPLVPRQQNIDFGPAAQYARNLTPLTLERRLPKGVLLNVNMPQVNPRRPARAALLENFAQLAAAGKRSARPKLFLAAEQTIKEGSSRTPTTPQFSPADLHHAAQARSPHTPTLNHLSHWAKQLSKWRRPPPASHELRRRPVA